MRLARRGNGRRLSDAPLPVARAIPAPPPLAHPFEVSVNLSVKRKVTPVDAAAPPPSPHQRRKDERADGEDD